MVLLKASDFALPQRRKRLFLIGVSNQRAQDEMKSTPDEILDRVVNVCLPAMRLSPPDVDTCYHTRNKSTINHAANSASQ